MDTSLISAGLLPSGTGAGKIKALYPIVGGTAATHKFNFVDPRDLDAAYRLSYFGGFTHNSNGITPNGINAEAEPFLTSLDFPQDSVSMGYYSKTNIFLNQIEIGDANTFAMSIYFGNVNGDLLDINNTYTSSFQTPPPKTNVFFQASRINSTTINGYFDSTNLGTLTIPSVARTGLSIKLFSYSGSFYSTKNCAFAYFGEGLTALEMGNLNSLVTTFQTTLGRQN
jgi:hypothetical protein